LSELRAPTLVAAVLAATSCGAPRDPLGSDVDSFGGSASSPSGVVSNTIGAAPEARAEALEVDGFLPAVLVMPATDRVAPVVIVAHGAGGRPEPHCDFYRRLVRGRGFILCTRGHPIDARVPADEAAYFYDGHVELGKEVRAALDALLARYGSRVDLERSVYAGFSQGASMGILALQQGVAPDARVRGILLVEGGWREWTIALAEKLSSEGVRRVAIVCGRLVCKTESDQSANWIRRGGLEAEVLYAPGAGHTYDGAVAPLVADAWRWIVDDDPRWQEPRAQ
jgi:dienelactone hydrolase